MSILDKTHARRRSPKNSTDGPDETRDGVSQGAQEASPRGDRQMDWCTARAVEDQNGTGERFQSMPRACTVPAVAWRWGARQGQAAVSVDLV